MSRPRSQVRAVIFDLDGVILDSEPWQKEAFDLTMKPFGISFSEREFSKLIGIRSIDNFKNIRKKYRLPFSAEKLTRIKSGHYQKILKKKIRPRRGLLPLLRRLKKKNYMLAVASGSARSDVQLCLKLLKIRRFFSAVLTGDDVKRGKPDPALFLKAARALGISPAECAVIEDSQNGVEAAQRAGMFCIALPTTLTGTHDITGAGRIIKNLSEAIAVINAEGTKIRRNRHDARHM